MVTRRRGLAARLCSQVKPVSLWHTGAGVKGWLTQMGKLEGTLTEQPAKAGKGPSQHHRQEVQSLAPSAGRMHTRVRVCKSQTTVKLAALPGWRQLYTVQSGRRAVTAYTA